MAKLATIICIIFIFYCFRTDLKKPNGPSNAIWIPLAWMFLAGSRWASSWLNLSTPMASADSYSEGSPIDRAVFLSLIVAGVFILSKRKVDWQRLLSQNKWIALYLLYCFSSIAWTDEPLVLFKRWIKDLGSPIMALVILTERSPYEAAGVILRRLAFLLLPLSILFIRYYPDLGRSYHVDGSPLYTGVGHQKNDLGGMCLISGIYFSWKYLQIRRHNLKLIENESVLDFCLIGMAIWLLRMSNSQTSLFSLTVAIGLFLAARVKVIAKKPSRIITFCLSSGVLFYILDSSLHLKDFVFEMLGRDSNLTNRTELWAVVRSLEVDPVFGAGFMSFWTGNRMEIIWKKMGTVVNQAHSGYLEQYLNLGYVGVGFILIILLSGLFKVRQHLTVDTSAAMLRLAFIVTAILVNYTEASFYGINNLWLLLLLAVIDISNQEWTKKTNNNHINGQKLKTAFIPRHRYRTVSLGGKKR